MREFNCYAFYQKGKSVFNEKVFAKNFKDAAEKFYFKNTEKGVFETITVYSEKSKKTIRVI